MADQRRRLAALDALARDPAATPAERLLAGEHAKRLRAAIDTGTETYVATEVDDVLVGVFDRKMAAAMTVRSRRSREARIRWIKHRAGPDVVNQWQAGRGRSISR